MALYFVRHQHSPQNCPARDPEMGQMLLKHLSKASASRAGVALHGEAVLDNQHTLVLIAEADERSLVEAYMQPFAAAGSVEIIPASECEAVVARGGCDVA